MTTDIKTLVKILVGVAWLDGKMQPEERRYLYQIAKEKGVANDLEIQPLLHELRAVKPEEMLPMATRLSGRSSHLRNVPDPNRID